MEYPKFHSGIFGRMESAPYDLNINHRPTKIIHNQYMKVIRSRGRDQTCFNQVHHIHTQNKITHFRNFAGHFLATRNMRPRPLESVLLLDPSQIHRPEEAYNEYNKFIISRTNKTEGDFRNYDVNLQTHKVHLTYTLMHENQTMEFVKQKKEKWSRLDSHKMTIMEAVHVLDALVDESDPDTDLPNSVHAFQTAERIRSVHPDKDWFHLTGLLHDLGKVMALWGEPQYCVVGDSFPLGCKFSEHIVFHETFKNNPDAKVPEYSSKYGIYEPNCGLDKVTMSWGHDEYMYHVLTGNNCKLPSEALYVIRYHSFFPWHCSGDYNYLCNDKDMKMLEWVKEFNKFDLYSKSDSVPDVEAVSPYYEELIAKYCPGELSW